MNDHHLDPPDDYDDFEGCPDCGALGEYIRDTDTGCIFRCDECDKDFAVKMPGDYDEPDPPDPGPVKDDAVGDPLCPHGNQWGDCGACDYLADLAYDAARENR